jgi:hypothetical protein
MAYMLLYVLWLNRELEYSIGYFRGQQHAQRIIYHQKQQTAILDN